jgi:hypothetical protein
MTDMKKLFYIIAAAALLSGLAGCGQKEETVVPVDLRYRVQDSYNLAAINPQSINILVKSTKPWTVRTENPEWCMIDVEEGEAVADTLVHKGKGENTAVRIQYYDNTDLDDRTDHIIIASGDYSKKVAVYQKGIAYLYVLDEEQAFDLPKAASEVEFHVYANQNWTVNVFPTDDNGNEVDWITITESPNKMDGVVKLSASENPGEKRYATVGVYDRHGEERAIIKFTQDGVQLDPDTFELRAGFDQTAATLGIISNANWELVKENPADDWYNFDVTSGSGNATVHITLTANAGTSLRKAGFSLKSVAAKEGDYVAVKEIVLKQAYKITPQRITMDNNEIGAWKSDWENPPVYTEGVGSLFAAKCRLNRSMAFGTYTFHWKDFVVNELAADAVRVRHWFCFDESAELKFDLRPKDAKVSFDFNAAGDGNKPSIGSFYDVDWTQPVDVTYKFDPSGAEYCHVTYLVNGVEAGSFDTSANLLRSVKWGSKINMYIGTDKSGGGSAVLEWYEFTPPMNWDE